MEVAASRFDITPSRSVLLAGGRKHKRAVTIAEALEANVVAFRIRQNEVPTVIVSMDLLYPGRLIREIVEDCYKDIPPQNIMLGSSHTHRGPMTDETKPRLGVVDPEYLKDLKDRFAAIRLTGPSMGWTMASMSKGTGFAHGAINRRLRKRFVVSRRPSINAYVNGPNPVGFKDEALKILIGRDCDGRALFVLWNYACHPVGYPTSDEIASHYPAWVRSRVRELLGNPSLPVVFLQGFSGNIRPAASAKLNGFSRRCRRAFTGPVFSDMSPAVYESWCDQLAKAATTAIAEAAPLHVEDIRTQRASLQASLFVGGAPEPEVTFQSILFVPDVCIVGASAEVVAEYIPIVTDLAASEEVFCVGCLDHVFGYAPTRKIYEEGGYEAGGFCDAFGLQGVNPDIETSMMSGFAKVLPANG